MAERTYRQLVVESIIPESTSAKSFHLVPIDRGSLDPYYPGQHLPLRLAIPGQGRPIFRCYTISNYAERFYRLTITMGKAPVDEPCILSGLSSSYFHNTIRVGDILEAKPPSGSFWLDLQKDHPIVMLAGGIGVTPMMSMLEALTRTSSRRDVYFFYGIHCEADHVFRARLSVLAERYPNIRMQVFYGNLLETNPLAGSNNQPGRISIGSLREHLPSLNMEYYICGPPSMMKALEEGLIQAGVANDRIRTESFGPSSITPPRTVTSDTHAKDSPDNSPLLVTFARSNIQALWTDATETLLELAEQNGIDISFGCRYGDCGTCPTRLLAGRVKYLHSTGVSPDPGYCLPCCCKPATAIVLDA